MIKRSLFSLIVILAILPLVSASSCYQEHPTSATVGDGTCGLMYDGFINPLLIDHSEWYDKDWNTYAEPPYFLELQYTQPPNITGVTWRVKLYDSGLNETRTDEYAIPDACLGVDNYRIDILMLNGFDGTFSCLTKSGSPPYIAFASGVPSDAGSRYYEESVIWNIYEPAPTPSSTPDIFYSVLSTSGNGLGSFISAIINPVFTIVVLLAFVGMIVSVIYLFATWFKTKFYFK